MKDQQAVNVLKDLEKQLPLTEDSFNWDIYFALHHAIQNIERQIRNEKNAFVKQKGTYGIENVSAEIIKFCKILSDYDEDALSDYDIRRIIKTVANKNDYVAVRLRAYDADYFDIYYC